MCFSHLDEAVTLSIRLFPDEIYHLEEAYQPHHESEGTLRDDKTRALLDGS